MGRLLNWPNGLGVRTRRPLSGPRSVGGTSPQDSIGGRSQSVASPFGAWKYEFVLPVAEGRLYRRIEGLITALHGGANAVRVPWPAPDALTLNEAGAKYAYVQERDGMPWDNVMPWANQRNWSASPPNVPVAANASVGATIIRLTADFWGYDLDMGDEIGFFPLHFGKYMITEARGSGEYRIWPPLRKAITTDDFATLKPVLAMKLDGEQAAELSRGVGYGEETTLILSEVFDYDVRDYFTV
ncbi:hypothetical protein FDR95_12170 [Rhizobiaceae bacterium LC148]|nr:hypothetical protein YH62_19235 [Rhizobium sp. LC145]TKT58357.1 hypothetical protein FDR95_12170 [Rhizobiaceae bacterium LC148]